jgi:hypothetical protein
MKKYTADQLAEYSITETTVTCTKCEKIVGDFEDDPDLFALNIFKKGWRATNNHCYCPTCAKKYLKCDCD